MLSASVVVVALVVMAVVVLVSVVVEVSVACAVNKMPLINAATATTDSSVKAVTFLFMWFHLLKFGELRIIKRFFRISPIFNPINSRFRENKLITLVRTILTKNLVIHGAV
jgi:hypothetical protein